VIAWPSKRTIPARRLDETADHVEDRSFSCAVRSDQTANRAALDGKRDVMHGVNATKGPAQLADFKNFVHDNHRLRRL
jgi:hypothetical protein